MPHQHRLGPEELVPTVEYTSHTYVDPTGTQDGFRLATGREPIYSLYVDLVSFLRGGSGGIQTHAAEEPVN